MRNLSESAPIHPRGDHRCYRRRAAALMPLTLAIFLVSSPALSREADDLFMSSSRELYEKYARAAKAWATTQDSDSEMPALSTSDIVPRSSEASRPRSIDVGRCSRPAGGVEGEIKGSLSQLSDLAVEVAWLRYLLRKSGFSSNMFEPDLVRWEKKRLQAMDIWKAGKSPRLDDLVRRIESRRAKARQDLPEITVLAGCHVSILERAFLSPIPDNGWAWYIDPFRWEVCRIEGINPWDTEHCGWKQATPSGAMPFRGTYYVQGRWPDGAIFRGTLKIKGELEGRKYPVYTVHSQNSNPGNPIFYGDDEEPPPTQDANE